MGGMVALRSLLFSFLVTLIFGQGITESGMNYFGLFEGTIPKVVNPKLTYYGGPVIPSVEVVEVIWGAPSANRTYITQLHKGGLMEKWYRSIVNSVYIDWLSEYKTPTQNISRGTFKGRYEINPSELPLPITDAQVQIELKKQFDARKLPLPNALGTKGKVKTVYMIHFPNQIQVSWTLGITCATICGYHGSFEYGSGTSKKYVPYAVIPSMAAGLCPKGCGKAANLYQNTQIVVSHELIESITDTRMMEAIPFVLPLTTHTPKRVSWYDLAHGEIADICLGKFGQIHHPTGGALTVQKQWSNFDKACIISRDFALSTSSSTTIRLTRNNSPVNINLIITQLGGSPQLIKLKTGVKPVGITVTFSQNNYNAGISIMTVKAGSGAPVGNQIMRIQAVGKDYTKRLQFTLQIS